MLRPLVSLVAALTLFIAPFSVAAPLSPTALTGESVPSLIEKGDKLYLEAVKHPDIKILNPSNEAYYRAWLQASNSELPLASYKFALSKLQFGDYALSNKAYESAMNYYLSGLALSVYPSLKVEETNQPQTELAAQFRQRIQNLLSLVSPRLDTVEACEIKAKSLNQAQLTLSAIGLYITLQNFSPTNANWAQAIQANLDATVQRRQELVQAKETIWVRGKVKDIHKLVNYMNSRVRKNWHPPASFHQECSGSVDFKINSDGSLTEIVIAKSANNKSLDAFMLEAVQKSSPIPARALKNFQKGQLPIYMNYVFEVHLNNQSQSIH